MGNAQSNTNVQEENSLHSGKEENTQIINRKEVENTPFVIVTTDQGSIAVMGSYRLTEWKKTEEEAENEIIAITWNNIIKVMSCIANHEINLNK